MIQRVRNIHSYPCQFSQLVMLDQPEPSSPNNQAFVPVYVESLLLTQFLFTANGCNILLRQFADVGQHIRFNTDLLRCNFSTCSLSGCVAGCFVKNGSIPFTVSPLKYIDSRFFGFSSFKNGGRQEIHVFWSAQFFHQRPFALWMQPASGDQSPPDNSCARFL